MKIRVISMRLINVMDQSKNAFRQRKLSQEIISHLSDFRIRMNISERGFLLLFSYFQFGFLCQNTFKSSITEFAYLWTTSRRKRTYSNWFRKSNQVRFFLFFYKISFKFFDLRRLSENFNQKCQEEQALNAKLYDLERKAIVLAAQSQEVTIEISLLVSIFDFFRLNENTN